METERHELCAASSLARTHTRLLPSPSREFALHSPHESCLHKHMRSSRAPSRIITHLPERAHNTCTYDTVARAPCVYTHTHTRTHQGVGRLYTRRYTRIIRLYYVLLLLFVRRREKRRGEEKAILCLFSVVFFFLLFSVPFIYMIPVRVYIL